MKKYTNKYKKEEQPNPSEKTLLITPMTIKNFLISLFLGWILYSCCNIYYEAGQKKKLDEQKKAEWCRNNPDACARYEAETAEKWKKHSDCLRWRSMDIASGNKVGKMFDDCPAPYIHKPWQ